MELNRKSWSNKDYVEFQLLLKDNVDDSYRKFHSKLCKTSKADILGVRLPVVKSFAKEISKGNVKDFLACCKNNSYEETMTEGFVIAFYKMPFEDKKKLISKFITKIDNWAVCDSFCSALKFKESELDSLFEFSRQYAFSEKEYDIRFSIVIMMDNLITEKYIDEVLNIFNNINTEYYYTSMAVAWSLSVCFVKFKEKTIAYMKNCSLDNLTYNRAIQKIIDSNRVSKEEKDFVRTLRRKKQSESK